jgi:hypothetical protein
MISMAVRARPMQVNDIRRCVEHISAHPDLGPRYGKVIEQLPAAIRYVLRFDYPTAIVFEEIQSAKTRYLGVGMAVFVNDEFLQEVKTTPFFWIAPELTKRIVIGKSPLLTDADVRDANSTTGLNLMMWHATPYGEDRRRAEVPTTILASFEECYRGFRLRELIGQADCFENMCGMLRGGGLYYRRDLGQYGQAPEVQAKNFPDEPRNVGMTRELAQALGGSWVGSLFLYEAPRCSFARSEQRLLEAAQFGGTDEELSKQLGISLAAVKKTWRSIYERAAGQIRSFDDSISKVHSETRGRQKKQHLLTYIREHPEELRPVSRRLLKSAMGSDH